MNGRLYRLTPAGGKPNHYTDSFRSAFDKAARHCDDLDSDYVEDALSRLEVGQTYQDDDGDSWERVA